MRKFETNLVPCNGCEECCRGDTVFLHPELGDKASEYETRVALGRYALANKENGDCVYLKRGIGCTIWNRRPAVCRELDCAIWLRLSPGVRDALIRDGKIEQRHLAAARRRVAFERASKRKQNENKKPEPSGK